MITASLSSCNSGGNIFVVSGYSADGAADVLLCRLHGNGTVEKISEITVGDNPSYFAFGRGGLIYFVNEVDTFNQKPGGGITTLRYDKRNKSLEKIGTLSLGSGGPCHITLSNDGNHLITANYGSGSVSVVRLNREGLPQKVTDRLLYGERSHPHMTLYNPRLRGYYVSDLGLDRVYQFRLDTLFGVLLDAEIPWFSCEGGSGPRHMAIDKSSANLYLISEHSSTVTLFNILSDSVTAKQSVSTLPAGSEQGSYGADIHLSRSGKKLYVSNRGHNSIATFSVAADGTLSDPLFRDCGGNWPRSFALSPSGRYIVVANQRSDRVSVLQAGSGAEEALSGLDLNAPSCVRFLK